jgi:hypothetical protein
MTWVTSIEFSNTETTNLDGDGSISPDEFRTVWKAMGLKISEYQLYKMMQTIDLDQNGYISFMEFLRGYSYIEELTGVTDVVEVLYFQIFLQRRRFMSRSKIDNRYENILPNRWTKSNKYFLGTIKGMEDQFLWLISEM